MAARDMPRLDRMVLWNAAEGEGCSFDYRRHERMIVWTAGWDLRLSDEAERAWDGLVGLHHMATSARCGVRVVKHRLQGRDPLSHAEAMARLDLPPGIVDPVSLFQMQDEAAGDLSAM
ncbi:hypothetical protein E4U53_005427 [Claviceps sorghi]|nr:hypothetical protein E4U53_005427 [Claviceps sorghi]